MFFRKRATQPEHFDDPARTPAEFETAYAELARANRIFRLEDPYTRVFWQWFGEEHCRALTFLDVGAGDGWLGNAMEAWARKLGWDWKVTNLDSNPVLLRLNRGGRNVIGSALDLPFDDASFDVVIASQMSHHLPDEAAVAQHFREAWRVARHAVFITDTHRNAFIYGMLCACLPFLRMRRVMINDGLMSVRRGWRRAEWIRLAECAGIPGAEISTYFASRIILRARKDLAAATRVASAASEPYRAMDESCSAPRDRSLQ